MSAEYVASGLVRARKRNRAVRAHLGLLTSLSRHVRADCLPRYVHRIAALSRNSYCCQAVADLLDFDLA